MPELAHYFGIRGAELADMGPDEINVYLARLADLPPIGATFLVRRTED